MFRRNTAMLAVTATAVVLTAPAAMASPGELDPAFGVGGLVHTDIAGTSDEAKAVAVAPDGKIVVAGLTVFGSVAETSRWLVTCPTVAWTTHSTVTGSCERPSARHTTSPSPLRCSLTARSSSLARRSTTRSNRCWRATTPTARLTPPSARVASPPPPSGAGRASPFGLWLCSKTAASSPVDSPRPTEGFRG